MKPLNESFEAFKKTESYVSLAKQLLHNHKVNKNYMEYVAWAIFVEGWYRAAAHYDTTKTQNFNKALNTFFDQTEKK